MSDTFADYLFMSLITSWLLGILTGLNLARIIRLRKEKSDV